MACPFKKAAFGRLSAFQHSNDWLVFMRKAMTSALTEGRKVLSLQPGQMCIQRHQNGRTKKVIGAEYTFSLGRSTAVFIL